MKKTERSEKLPSLDGWRAFSIVLVLASHSVQATGFPLPRFHPVFSWLETLGLAGVRCFFVISGFLITYLLLRERAKHGRIGLKDFYVRRGIRILPVCLGYLLVLGCFTRYSQPWRHWLANLTFTTDFFMPDFLRRAEVMPTGHLWSLAVEEQFYILWPWVLVWVLNRHNAEARLVKLLLLPLVVAPLVRVLEVRGWYPANLEFLFTRFSFFAKVDSLAYGCLAAVVFHYRRETVAQLFQRRFLVGFFGWLLVVSPWRLPWGGQMDLAIYVRTAAFDALQGLGFALLLMDSVLHPERSFYRILNWRWVAWLGVLSYSIYVWQQMFWGTGEAVFGRADAWWVAFPYWLGVTLVVAAASYYLLEKPLLGLRRRFRRV